MEGEAADTVKVLRNSEAASEATRARLNRKYGGIKRQIQKLMGIRASPPCTSPEKKFARFHGGELWRTSCPWE